MGCTDLVAQTGVCWFGRGRGVCHSMGTVRCKPREETSMPNRTRCSQLKADTSSLGALALFTCEHGRGVTTSLEHNGFRAL